jgi:3-hydroxyacyl-[acyl-carrier-protein] dehydratase
MSILNTAQIQALLPHRHPMLLVDAVVAVDPRRSIVARKCVTRNEPCYASLSEAPTERQVAYPRCLIVESFSQAGVILWRHGVPPGEAPGVLMFGIARDCDFERDVFPGETMEHRVQIDRAFGDSLLFSGETWVGSNRVARFGWLMAVTRPASGVEHQP